MVSRYKYFRQLDFMDCGPTCLKMVAAHYGKDYSLDYLRANSYITRSGVSLLGISDAAERIGFKTLKAKLSYRQLTEEAPLPCILHWNQEHFVVLYDVRKTGWNWLPGRKQKSADRLVIGDPGHALVTVDKDTFMKCWSGTADEKGISLLLEPTPEFYQLKEETQQRSTGFHFLFEYLTPYKRYITQVLLGMLIASIVSMVFPFLTQSLVDYGIHRHNLNFIHLILLSQLLLFIGNIAVDLIRNWILLHISTRVSVTIISNFLVKLMKLPINFFESKNIGDISQRIQDHHRIETFLTGATLNTLFSVVNLLIFSIVLGTYSGQLLGIFVIGSVISIGWITIFLNQRKDLDYRRFQRMRENQNTIYELITGMQEIKLNNCEKARRWEWERIQAKLFKINIKGLALEQYQEVGSSFVTQLKNILISYIAATLVIDNQITLGVMLSISYIIGQMNGPLSQLMSFMRSIQDAKISLDRLGEVHNKPDEELDEERLLSRPIALSPDGPSVISEGYFDDDRISAVYGHPHQNRGINLRNVSFRYGGPNSTLVLNDLTLHIPEGKVTAIVGTSGSGKTTLLKLLLKFYPPASGEIIVNGSSLTDLSAREWRKSCGTVMQDGYIFSDTIARNIAVDGQKIDEDRLWDAVRVANLQDYLRKIPLGFTTKIGNSGAGLSGGQRQRIFIARAVYKNPSYIFFDEATSALDANNERIIMDNLDQFFKGRTVVVIAHRLSTVKNADQIIVLDHGQIKEVGNHSQLTARRGFYYELVKNQLELADA
ncbi:peptidase domain-containing ABC transporter [Spirosoma sp. SC4-14]|uniref:peptidase domain-containing ABC transporter n=1 Tax=Spirosoma sp. SC4-14 TaxID=3128900 RepID=UPI0030CF66BA